MLKLSGKEKRILSYLIINCQIYQLTENDSLEYIKDKFSKSISRRTYYNYKNQIYKNHEKNSLDFLLLNNLGTNNYRSWVSLSFMSERERIIKKGVQENNIKFEEFMALDNFPKLLEKVYENIEPFIEKSQKYLDKLNLKKAFVTENFKLIPTNATIRIEYTKCGKEFCLRCEHGPYYYAYWRGENGKVKKKYIGKIDPRIREREVGADEENYYSNELENILSNKQNDLNEIFQR